MIFEKHLQTKIKKEADFWNQVPIYTLEKILYT